MIRKPKLEVFKNANNLWHVCGRAGDGDIKCTDFPTHQQALDWAIMEVGLGANLTHHTEPCS